MRTVSESIDKSLAARTKLINIITICRRAGKLEMGFDASVQSAEKHKARLIFTAADVSPKTAKEAEFAAEKYNVLECIECGLCSYICPANKNLLQFIRMIKPEVMKKKREESIRNGK